jgi:integrase
LKGCRPLTEAEVVDVGRSFGGRWVLRDRALFVCGCKTGFRISELLSLTLGDVVSHGRITQYLSVHRRHMKKKREGRTVKLNPAAREVIEAWVAEMAMLGLTQSSTPLFLSRRRDRDGKARSISRVQGHRILREAYAANELDGRLGTHTMRKTFAGQVYERLGRDLFRTQQALGHKSPGSTVAYLSFMQTEIDEAIEAL